MVPQIKSYVVLKASVSLATAFAPGVLVGVSLAASGVDLPIWTSSPPR